MTKPQLLLAVSQDPTLSKTEKAEIVTKLGNEEFLQEILHGAAGAGTALVIAKYFNLSKPAQALITLAGFGVGRYLLDESRKHDRFLQYDDKLKTYKINA